MDAGGTTMGQSGGGAELTSYFPQMGAVGPNNLTMSLGVLDGRMTGGVEDSFRYHGGDLNIGSQSLSQGIGGTGLLMNGVGIGYLRGKEDAVGVFAGAVGTSFALPYFTGVPPSHAGGAIFAKHRYGHFKLGTIAADSGSLRTALASVNFKSKTLDATAVGGLLNKQDFSSAYISYRPSLTFSANFNHYDTFVPLRTTSDSIGAGYSRVNFNLSGSVTRSSSLSEISLAENIQTTVRFGIFQNQVAVYNSRSGLQETDTVTEKISRHLQMSQMFSDSYGTKNVSFGGDYTSNRLSCGLDYGMGFIPLTGTFQKTTSVHVSLSIHGNKMTAQVLTTAGIRPEYSASTEKYVQGPLSPVTQNEKSSSGKYEVLGVVHDVTGAPLQGIAVKVGEFNLYTNRDGQFLVHAKSDKDMELTIDLSGSLNDGEWVVKESPKAVRPTRGSSERVVTIILMRP
jgi:hypothetical protein